MCKQLKENLSQTFMSSMESMIDMLDEHSKSIKKTGAAHKPAVRKGQWC